MEIDFRNDWINNNLPFKQFAILDISYEATYLEDVQHCFSFVIFGLGFHLFIIQEYDIKL